MSAELHTHKSRSQRATEIVERLPHNELYENHYQFTYPDLGALESATYDLLGIGGITTPRNVDAVQHKLAAIATSASQEVVVIAASCDEKIDENASKIQPTLEALQTLALLSHSAMGSRIYPFERNRGQSSKRRTAQYEVTENGLTVVSYGGGTVNSEAIEDRTPDPKRAVRAATHALTLELGLLESLGTHVPAAHDALTLFYEDAFIRRDTVTGNKYLLSADMPWLGASTNNPYGYHAQLLKDIENPVGVKVNAHTTPDQIVALTGVLNPSRKAGKLAFLLRIGLKNAGLYPDIIEAIETEAPNSIILVDIHGATKMNGDGTKKIRYVGDITDEISLVSGLCDQSGTKLHGLSLETTTDSSRLECVDEVGQDPTHKGQIDPRLNPQQLHRVIEHAASELLAA